MESKYTLIDRKRFESEEEMSSFERKLWRRLDHDEEYEEEINLDIWRWAKGDGTSVLLHDLYYWPGDNQHGIVFSGYDAIYENHDTSLTPIVDHTLENEASTLSELKCNLYLL